MNAIERFKAPTPEFWKKVRNITGVVAGIAGALLVAPVALPVATVTALTYIAVIGGTIAGTAQFTKEDK